MYNMPSVYFQSREQTEGSIVFTAHHTGCKERIGHLNKSLLAENQGGYLKFIAKNICSLYSYIGIIME